MVVNSCLKFINAQFKLLSIDDRFHCAAELIMMSDRTQSNIFPSHTKWFLDRILEGKEEQRTIYLAFVHLGGIGTVLSRAATKANLTEEEKQALIEIKRSQILLENIGSDFSSSSVTARHSLFSSSDSDSAAGTAPKQFDGETFLAHFAVDLVLAKSVEIQEKDGVCSFVFPETTDLKDLEALSERLFERGGFDSRLHEANKGGRKIGPRLEIIENRKELEAWMDEQKVRSNPH